MFFPATAPSSHQIQRLLSTSSDDNNQNTWEPFKSKSDFNLDMALILIAVLSFIVGAFVLNFLLNRYINKPGDNSSSKETKLQQIEKSAGPSLEFFSGLKLAGTEAICAICLSEFVNGEGIRVLSKCNHGFHVKCIEKWLLSSHISCPTCRTICMGTTSTSPEGNSDDHLVDVESGPVELLIRAEQEQEQGITAVSSE